MIRALINYRMVREDIYVYVSPHAGDPIWSRLASGLCVGQCQTLIGLNGQTAPNFAVQPTA
jgi:hypothetical protein